MINNLIKNGKKHLDEHINGFRENLNTIKAGRANPGIVENITFKYYGTDTPIKNAATITVPEARLLVIQPWDASQLKEIEKAILAANIGINPSNDGKVLRLPFPELTEQTRKDLVKEVKQRGEQSKIGIRNYRRELMDVVKKAEKDKEISEDERKSYEKDVQDLIDEYIKKLDEITNNKEKELLTV